MLCIGRANLKPLTSPGVTFRRLLLPLFLLLLFLLLLFLLLLLLLLLLLGLVF